MKEIEVKVKVNNFDQIKSNLEKIGCELSNPIKQEDQIYLPIGVKFSSVPLKTNVLRIRIQPYENLFTLKQSNGDELVSLEKEVTIGNPKALSEIINLLGYYEAVKVSKIRTKCQYKKYEICLDSVRGLGNFIEIEAITSVDEEKTKAKLLGFLGSIGVDIRKRVYKGYDTMTSELKNEKY